MGGAEKEKTGLKKCTIAPNLTPVRWVRSPGASAALVSGRCALGCLVCFCPLIECMIYYTGAFGGWGALPRRRTCGQTLGKAAFESTSH